MGMTKAQKFRRVLFSRYGVLALISIGLIPVLMLLLPEGKGGGDRVLGLVLIGLLLTPIAIFVQGLAIYEDLDYKKRLEEDPELEQPEDLISFLYEDEQEEK
jgi:hypothetical protein